MKFLSYQPLRVAAKPSDVFFWSDTHFNHRCDHWKLPLWKARGFSSVEDHTEGLIERWNSTCSCNSVIFHLGDFIFGYNSVEQFKNIVNRLSFKELYIMPGNHASGWKQVFEEQKGIFWRPNSQKTVFFVPNYLEATVDHQLVVMSHYPILSFNGQSKGSFCLYGHVHGNLHYTAIGKMYNQARTMEVTVESCSVPISMVQVSETLSKIPSVVFDSHESFPSASGESSSNLS